MYMALLFIIHKFHTHNLEISHLAQDGAFPIIRRPKSKALALGSNVCTSRWDYVCLDRDLNSTDFGRMRRCYPSHAKSYHNYLNDAPLSAPHGEHENQHLHLIMGISTAALNLELDSFILTSNFLTRNQEGETIIPLYWCHNLSLPEFPQRNLGSSIVRWYWKLRMPSDREKFWQGGLLLRCFAMLRARRL